MTVVFYYLVLILHFCCFQSFKELVSVFVETDCKVTTFFWIDKIFQKKYLFFFSNVCVLNSQATSLDCGCKGTAFSDTTKIFLCFFLNFFISGCFSKRKIFIFLCFLWILWSFCGFLECFFARKRCSTTWFFRVFGFFCVFWVKRWFLFFFFDGCFFLDRMTERLILFSYTSLHLRSISVEEWQTVRRCF